MADASPQVGGDTQRALDGHPQAVVAEPRLAFSLRLLRNRQRNLGCVSTISRIDVNASQEHRMAIANTSTSIRLDSNLCPSRTRCLLPVPLLLAKRATSPRSLAGTETDASITKRENASSGMHPRRHRCASLGAALMHAAASMCVTPTRADLNGLHERSHAAYIVPNVSDVPLRSCFMPAHKTGRRIRHPDVEFPSVKFGRHRGSTLSSTTWSKAAHVWFGAPDDEQDPTDRPDSTPTVKRVQELIGP